MSIYHRTESRIYDDGPLPVRECLEGVSTNCNTVSCCTLDFDTNADLVLQVES